MKTPELAATTWIASPRSLSDNALAERTRLIRASLSMTPASPRRGDDIVDMLLRSTRQLTPAQLRQVLKRASIHDAAQALIVLPDAGAITGGWKRTLRDRVSQAVAILYPVTTLTEHGLNLEVCVPSVLKQRALFLPTLQEALAFLRAKLPMRFAQVRDHANRALAVLPNADYTACTRRGSPEQVEIAWPPVGFASFFGLTVTADALSTVVAELLVHEVEEAQLYVRHGDGAEFVRAPARKLPPRLRSSIEQRETPFDLLVEIQAKLAGAEAFLARVQARDSSPDTIRICGQYLHRAVLKPVAEALPGLDCAQGRRFFNDQGLARLELLKRQHVALLTKLQRACPELSADQFQEARPRRLPAGKARSIEDTEALLKQWHDEELKTLFVLDERMRQARVRITPPARPSPKKP